MSFTPNDPKGLWIKDCPKVNIQHLQKWKKTNSNLERSGEVILEMWLSRRLLKDRSVRGLPAAGVVCVAGATLVEVCVATTLIIYCSKPIIFINLCHKFTWVLSVSNSSSGNARPDHARCLLHFRQHEPVPCVVLTQQYWGELYLQVTCHDWF